MHRLLPGLAVLALSCSGQSADCVSDNDCFHGEVCRSEGICGTPVVTVDSDAGNNAVSGADSGTTPGDMATNSGDSGSPSPDMSTPGDDTGAAPDMAGGACIVDPFDQCEDDEDPSNNSFPGASFTSMTRGCQPTFVPMDETISGRQCALDPEDLYGFLVVECDADEPGMVIEATLTVKDDCDPDLIWFDVEQIGTSCAEPNLDSDKTLRCETLPGGERRISIIWPGSSVPVVAAIKFSIQTPDRTDVQFDYDLNIVVREP